MLKTSKISKIAIVMENFDYGGATTHLINLLCSKEFKKMKFILFTNKNNSAVQNIINNCGSKNIKIVYFNSLNAIKTNNFFVKLIFFLLRPILFTLSVFQMYFIIKKYHFNIFLADCGGYGDFRTEMSSILASKMLKLNPTYLLIHHSYTKPRFWKFIINIFDYFIGKIVSNIFFVSNATKKSVEKNTWLTKSFKKEGMVIHNGVWLKKIKNQKLKKIFNVRNNVIKVGMLARLEKYKGQIDLVEGFNNLPQNLKDRYKVFFIGSGTQKELNNLRFKITEYNLKKYFKILKYIKGDSLSVIKNLDLLVSLTRDFEGFGYSIAESLYVGTPILSTNVGGVREFLNDKNSKLIKPMDISAISKSLKDFAYRRKAWNKRAYEGKKLIIKKFNSEIMSRKFLREFLKDLNFYKYAI